MTVKKQPKNGNQELCESANDWFRQFLKHLEIDLALTGRELHPNSRPDEYYVAVLRAVKLTLQESGASDDEIVNLFGQIVIEERGGGRKPEWNAALNRRRFELIDGEIQGSLSRAEVIELAGLTQLMRDHLDSEVNLPFEGARKLHQRLIEPISESMDAEQ